MADFSPDTLSRLLSFLAALSGLAAALWAGVEAARRLTGMDRRKAERKRLDARLDALEKRLDDCESRLSRGDRLFSAMRADSTQTLTVLNALLMHEITGNSIDKLKTVKSGLDAYLSGRQAKGEK